MTNPTIADERESTVHLRQFQATAQVFGQRDREVGRHSTMDAGGLTIIEAIKTARELFGVSLAEAKLLISSHPDWQQTAAAAAPLHEEIIQAFENADAGNGERTDA